MAGTRTVIYVAATSDDAESGAAALEADRNGFDVEPATPDAVDYAAEVADCIVFAETPTTAEGATVLDVIDDADGTPVVLFSDHSFEPAMARSTDGIAGYVRRDAPDAVTHLADEIAWVCSGPDEPNADGSAESATRHRRAAEHLAAAYASVAGELTERTAERDRLDDATDHLEGRLDRAADERDRFRAAFDVTPDPACAYVIDTAGTATVIAVNGAFRATFGIGTEAAVETPVADVFDAAGIDLDGDRFRSALDPQRADCDWIASGRSASGPGVDREPPVEPDRGSGGPGDGVVPADAIVAGSNRETTLDGRYETDDGVRAYAVTVVPPASATAGTAASVGLVGCSDVTDRRRAEQELAARTRRLEAVGDVLDDVRDPLSVARGYLEVAEETGDPEHFAEIDEAHEALREAADHLGRLVGRDAAVVSRETVDLHDLARQVWADVETADASLDLGPNARFEADRDQLRGAFERLFAAATGASAGAGNGESSGSRPDDASGPHRDDGGESGRDDREESGSGDHAASNSNGGAAITVGATEDGFYVASSVAVDGDSFAGRMASADGTGPRRGVERAASVHGWRVGVAESDEGTAIAFRGVDVERGS